MEVCESNPKSISRPIDQCPLIASALPLWQKCRCGTADQPGLRSLIDTWREQVASEDVNMPMSSFGASYQPAVPLLPEAPAIRRRRRALPQRDTTTASHEALRTRALTAHQLPSAQHKRIIIPTGDSEMHFAAVAAIAAAFQDLQDLIPDRHSTALCRRPFVARCTARAKPKAREQAAAPVLQALAICRRGWCGGPEITSNLSEQAFRPQVTADCV